MEGTIILVFLSVIHKGFPTEECCTTITLTPKEGGSDPRIYDLVQGETGNKIRQYNCVNDCYYTMRGGDQNKQMCMTRGSSNSAKCTPPGSNVEEKCCKTISVSDSLNKMVAGEKGDYENTGTKRNGKEVYSKIKGVDTFSIYFDNGKWNIEVKSDQHQRHLWSFESTADCPSQAGGLWDNLYMNNEATVTLECKEA